VEQINSIIHNIKNCAFVGADTVGNPTHNARNEQTETTVLISYENKHVCSLHCTFTSHEF
jgi:hypothetical protein